MAPAAMASAVGRTSVCTGGVRDDLPVDDPLDAVELVARHRLEVDEVEPQPIRRDERARLLDVSAEHLAQRRMKQVRGRVIAPRRVAQISVDLGRHDIADTERAGRRRAR